MRFVITVEDVVLFGLLAIGIVLALIGVILSWVKNMGEKVQKKTWGKR